MAIPVEEAIAALSTFSLEDEQADVQGLAISLSNERCATNSPIEFGDVAAYRLSIAEDTKAINQLNALIQEGREMASLLYTYRSCVKALPQLPDSMKHSQADLYLETYQVLDLEMSRLREIQRWQMSAATKLAADMQRFSRPERLINGPTITHFWSMLKLLDVLVQLDHLKNAKASIPNDFSWYKRTFTQVSVQWQDTDSMREELDDLQIFLSTRWAILLNLHAEMFRTNPAEDILQSLIVFCVESLELDFALLFPERHTLLRVLPVLVVLATSSEKDSESLYKRVKINRLLNIFKNDPVIPAFPDLHLSPAAIMKELSMYFQNFSSQARLLTLPAPHEIPPRDLQDYQRHYLIVNHIATIRAEHDDFSIRFASAMNQIVVLKSTDGNDYEWHREVKGNMYDMVVEGFQLLSRWTGRLWEQCAWKFSRPCKEPAISSHQSATNFFDYEKVVRWNYTADERKTLLELIGYIKSVGLMMQRCDTLVADALLETIHAEVQDFVQDKLDTMLRTTFRKKKDLSRILSDMRTLSADWMANTTKTEVELHSVHQENEEFKQNIFYPRPVAPTAAQIHCLQFLICELVSGGNLRKPGGLFGNSGSGISVEDLKQLETFFYKLSFFLHILDFTATIGALTDLGFLWFREFYLESSRVIQACKDVLVARPVTEMSRFHNRWDQDLQLPFPGCIGKMINIFDLSAGMTGTKLLTDRAHRDDSPVRRSKSDTKKATHPINGYVDDKQMGNEMKRRSSSQRSGGTPMKMLIAEEMSKETEPRRKSPSVVARLMGLDDDMPAQQPVVAPSKRNSHGNYPRSNSAGRREQDVHRIVIPHGIHKHDYEEMEFKDIHEVWQQPSRVSITKDQYVQWGNCKGNDNDKRMALVRQKFMEAKRLATDEKLLHSQEFHDALEVLSSNRDLFLKFLEEPRSLFSKQVNDLESIPPLAQTKRITILKPSKMAEAKSEKPVMRQRYGTVDNKKCESNKPHWNSNYNNLKAERFSQPTKIVVLKPGTANPHGMKANITYPTSPEPLEQNYLSGDSEDSDDLGSRHIRKDFTQQMREISNRHRRDESLLSSVYSNGYGGDESSFHMSESEYIEEDGGCFSDSEAVTPTLRHSWDYANRYGSPYSISSFSRASFSPESSVIREAKKRLSERWALVASSGINQGVHLRRSSSTLGEMLAIRDVKKQENNQSNGQTSGSKSYVQENELRAPASCLPINKENDAEGDGSVRSLSRSKSVPISSSTYEDIGFEVEVSSANISKSTKSKDVTKSKKGKISLKGRVSNLLFSKPKKLNGEESVSLPQKKEKPDPPHLVGFSDKMKSADTSSAVDGKNELLTSRDLPVQNPQNYDEGRTVSPKPVIDGTKEGTISPQKTRINDNFSDKDALRTYETLSANQDQPSPTSVLDAPFEDEGNDSAPPSESGSGQQKQLSKASAIDSVARILSWDDSHSVLSSPKLSRSCYQLSENEEHEYIALVQKLLLSAGLQTTNRLFAGWFSLDSPLDPMLFDKFCDHKDEEAMCREKRSNMRFLFDCVNLALLEISRTAFVSAYPWTKLSLVNQKEVYPCSKLSLNVSELVVDWFSGKGVWLPAESENGNQMVDTVLRREVRGKAWAESMKLEVEEISKEISGEVLDDLVVEALAEFTGIH